MNELLSDIVRAHGGFSRWRALNRVEATIVTGGGLWALKGLAQDPDPRRMTVDLHQQRASLKPFGDPDWHTEFAPDRIAIRRGDGSIVAERENPRAAFTGHDVRTAWDPLHRAYFNGYALWLYLTTPFLLAREGVRVYEIEPWIEHGETWSVLRAEFSGMIATHSAVQDFYFGDDLLLRRHDYAVDVAGGFAAAQLVHDYIGADGIRLPSKRRVYVCRSDRRPDLSTLLVSIDISDVRFS
ncbi:hypothetical protein [Taklimakanibacter deserti]|uniref:hypothetical protein n=1 Tax=Taklimakanibacter deserti TaxID=2267839 RepID=UPI000E6511E2